MEQLSFLPLEELEEDDNKNEGFLIPKDVLCPLESKEKPYTKKFQKQQKEFSDYVRLIQNIYNCSWFEAREIFFDHRDNEKPLNRT